MRKRRTEEERKGKEEKIRLQGMKTGSRMIESEERRIEDETERKRGKRGKD